jgi:predicted lipid-binding transport protein (Tim44 family)
MQGTSWIALLARIPAEQTENLLVITNNGTGIAVKGIVRAENEYMVVRGRLLGTVEEGGGFFFVPYDQINYVGFQTLVKETVIRAMYEGEPAASIAAAAEKKDDVAADATESAPASAEPTDGGPRPAAPGKAALLERLRARRASPEAKN